MQNLEISSLIPQKAPFVMVDRLLECDEISTKTSFKVTPENVLVANGEFTEAGLMENIAQSAAAGTGYSTLKENKPVINGYIALVKNFEVFNLPKVNDELLTKIKIENQVFDMTVISGEITCKEVLMARCEMNILIEK